MSTQNRSKQAHELGCLKAAQESLAEFPQGEIRPGDDPPDCYVATHDGGHVAFELTEQADRIAVEATVRAKRFLKAARNEFFLRYPEYRTGWKIVVSPGDIFETSARVMKNRLINRFVLVVAGELVKRHSFEWQVPGEPIWTFDICQRDDRHIPTTIDFQVVYRYSPESEDRIVNRFGRDVTFKPVEIQKRIAAKVTGLKRYTCRPTYLLISASLFPRSVRSTGSFGVLTTPRSIVNNVFNIGGFSAVFLHDPTSKSYRIGKDGRAVELQRRLLS